jgi:hypothetical protein
MYGMLIIWLLKVCPGIIKNNTGRHLMLNLKDDDRQGYVGTFNIGVNATQKW